LPKLNVLHRLERLNKRIEDLENNKAIEAREINSLLTDEQKELLKKLWAEQQNLRKQSAPKTDKEKKQLGWKTKKEVRIDVLKQALSKIIANLDEELGALIQKKEAKAAKVYLDAYFEAKNDGKNAWAIGNAALQRAGFSGINGRSSRGMSRRDKEVFQMEDKLRSKTNSSKKP